ncbi:hypothetical protein [Zhongshania aliphaticivorans]|uniref:hypothetical protein n=1 Tax=Zhongshania aliphaticivorans TaxID=1470434 RepID=UPI0012E488AC|nr:hypothetical protein [Zhongshania aliphaticivorans]CAA0117957.1 Uncharacterised protein [Zhongshania aliphaticivorans]
MNKAILVRAVTAFSVLIYTSATLGAQLNIDENTSLFDAIEDYQFQMESELLAQGKNYHMAYGIAGIAGAKGSTAYVTSVNTAYQFALAQAYAQLAGELGAEMISAETSVNVTSTGGPAEALVADCEEQHKVAKQDTQTNESFLDVVKGAIRSLTSSDEEKAEKSKLESIIDCTSTTDRRLITDVVSRSVNDSFSGARIVQSVIHQGQLGVIIGLSSETAEVAGVLSSQQSSAKTNLGAKAEIQQWVRNQLDAQTGSVLGLVGSRMTKLSNGEWAVVGFGIAPASEPSASNVMNSSRIQSERKISETNAIRELARFSNMAVAHKLDQSTKDDTHAYVQKHIEDGSSTVSQLQKNVILSQLEQAYKTQTTLRLKGASKVVAKKYSDDGSGVDFYLTAYAWSPSMLSAAEQFRSETSSAFDKGKSGSTSVSVSGQGKSTGNTQSAPVISEDW